MHQFVKLFILIVFVQNITCDTDETSIINSRHKRDKVQDDIDKKYKADYDANVDAFFNRKVGEESVPVTEAPKTTIRLTTTIHTTTIHTTTIQPTTMHSTTREHVIGFSCVFKNFANCGVS